MATFKTTPAYGISKHVVGISLVTSLTYIALDNFSIDLNKLSIETYYQSIMTFVTGAMVAIFLAVFFSNTFRAQYIQKHAGAFTLFAIFLIEMVALVFSGLLIDNENFNRFIFSFISVTMLDFALIVGSIAFVTLKK